MSFPDKLMVFLQNAIQITEKSVNYHVSLHSVDFHNHYFHNYSYKSPSIDNNETEEKGNE